MVLVEVGYFSFEMKETGIVAIAKPRLKIEPYISAVIMIVQRID